MKLVELAKVIRSKNAGPFSLTLDIMIDNEETYEAIKASGVLSAELIAKLYSVPAEKVAFFVVDNCWSFKATIPLIYPASSMGNIDVYGAQQHAPLYDIEIPM